MQVTVPGMNNNCDVFTYAKAASLYFSLMQKSWPKFDDKYKSIMYLRNIKELLYIGTITWLI